MPDAPQPTREELIAFVDSLPLELKAQLVRTRDEQKALDMLAERVAALGIEATTKRKDYRKAYRDEREKRFANFAWSKALAGAPVEHAFVMPLVLKATMRPPTGEAEAAYRTWHQKQLSDESSLLPVTNHEAVLLTWLTTFQMLSPGPDGQPQPSVNLTSIAFSDRLRSLRKLPAQVTVRIANEALELEAWLSVVMEDELGNS